MLSTLQTLHALAQAQPPTSLRTRIIGSLFFGATALGAFTVALFCAYETIAIATGWVPTISVIVGGWASEHPIWTPVITFFVGMVVAALIVHFTGWRP